MLTINKEQCTGCGACVQRCPQNCISWQTAEFGFFYPVIDEKKCVDCGLCERVCPIDKDISHLNFQKFFAAVHNNKQILSKSTSGGAFSAIAEKVIEKKGVVYGVIMNDDARVHHIRVDNNYELIKMRGSKYVQSRTVNTYKQAEEDLKKGITVLYTGTPCQIFGLKKFLGKEYSNLYTIDIVCHGVGSQEYFDKYMEFARERYGEIREIQFRSKEFSGWSCGSGCIVSRYRGSQSDEARIPYNDYENYYYSYFLLGDIYRNACYLCKYANTNRVGDFTLGDFWGVESLKLPLNTSGGCSLIIVNNQRAMKFLEEIDTLDMLETTIEQATKFNNQLKSPSSLHSSREKRLLEFETMDGKSIQKEYIKSHLGRFFKGYIKSRIPYRLKLFIRSKR